MASIVDTSRDGLDFSTSDLGRTRARASVGAHEGRVLVSLYVVLLIFIPPSLIIGPLGAFGSPATLVGLLCLALWMVNKLLPHGAFAPRRQPIYLAVTIYAAVVLASYLWAHVHYLAPDQATGADNFLLINAARLGVMLMAADALRTVDDIKYVLKWLTRMAAFSATVALLQFLTDFDLVLYIQKIPPLSVNSELMTYASRGAFERVAGTATHALEFGTMAAMVVVHAVNRMFHEKEHKVRHVLMVGVIAMGIPISISRSALLAGAIVLIWLIAASPAQRRRQLVAIVFAFIGVVFIAVPGLLGALRESIFGVGQDTSLALRLEDYAWFWENIKKSQWLGTGPGTLLPRLRIFDNQYLATTIETGWIGLAAMIGFHAYPVVMGASAARRTRFQEEREIAAALAGSCCAFLAVSATFDSYAFPQSVGTFYVCAGLAAAMWSTIWERDHGYRA
jgi:hypothetical protein